MGAGLLRDAAPDRAAEGRPEPMAQARAADSRDVGSGHRVRLTNDGPPPPLQSTELRRIHGNSHDASSGRPTRAQLKQRGGGRSHPWGSTTGGDPLLGMRARKAPRASEPDEVVRTLIRQHLVHEGLRAPDAGQHREVRLGLLQVALRAQE